MKKDKWFLLKADLVTFIRNQLRHPLPDREREAETVRIILATMATLEVEEIEDTE